MAPRNRFKLRGLPSHWPVRLILVGIVFTLLLPGLGFSALLMAHIAINDRNRSETLAQNAAIRAGEALDREIGNTMAALFALSTSPAIDFPDLSAFHKQIVAVSRAMGQPMALSDAEGRQLVSSRYEYGTPLPRMRDLTALNQSVRTRAPSVSNLMPSSSTGIPTLVAMFPITRGDGTTAVFAMALGTQQLSNLLRSQTLPEGWVAAVVDGNGTIIARNRDEDRFIGRQAVALSAPGNGARQTSTLDGTPILSSSQQLQAADWRVTVGIPMAVVNAPLRVTLTLLVIGGGVTLLVAGLLARQLASTLSHPLKRLALAGTALAEGKQVDGVRSAIAEVDAVSRALVTATADLRHRNGALAAERARLAAIIDTVPVGLAIAEADGRIVAGNAQLEAMLRHRVPRSADDTSYGEWVAHHADGSAVGAHENPLTRVLQGAPSADLQCLYRRGDGTDIWARFVAAPFHGPDGTLLGGVVAALDIDEVVRARQAQARFSESLEHQVVARTAELQDSNQRLRDEIAARAAAEEQLRQAQKMEAVGQLTGGIAHDFNNLLTIIIGSLDLLRRRAVDDRSARLLNNALAGAGRAATLTARLLAFSRRQPLLPRPVDVNALVTGMMDLLRRTLGERIVVRTALADAVWHAHADPNQLESALLNLANNARDAIRDADQPGGTLTVETANAELSPADLANDADSTPGAYVRIAVTDTGTGMPPDILARVFEPFFTTKPIGSGTGLGLSQVQGFAKQSGGLVTVQTRPGRGTTVAIYLPRLDETPVPEAATPTVETLPPARPLRILLVEDDAEVRRFSAEALRELGHTAREASNAEEALAILGTDAEVDLLLTDVMLPGQDGVALAAAARRARPDLPVLFATGYENGRLPQGTTLDDDATLLAKPFTLAVLAEKLAAARDPNRNTSRNPVRPAGLEPATKPL